MQGSRRLSLVAMTDVTRILNQIEQGDPSASKELLPLVYEELRVLARQRMANENPGQTMQPTGLVHEAYIRLLGNNTEQSWDNRGHFFAAAAEAMRRILIDNARKKKSAKHGGQMTRVNLDQAEIEINPAPDDLLALDDAVSSLEEVDPISAEIAKLRLFCGLEVEDAAKSLGISRSNGFRQWQYARAYLQSKMNLSE